ncbi:class I adenylate-forming enzyme family protein [Streptomyces sp. NPDC048254]|uniref:class I adenylate-forming enzyme family protein n=1 Tax=Streptomyces sp. NPDC048254 TaxID=3365525 RepID=UPI0037104F3D
MLRRAPLHYPDRPLTHFLRDAADRHPEWVALDHGAHTLTFRELDGLSNSFARACTGFGLEAGRRAAVVMHNRLEWLPASYGFLDTGASVALPNPSWTEHEMAYALSLTRPRLVVADAAAAVTVERSGYRPEVRICVDADAPEGWLSFWDLVHNHPGTRLPELAGDLATLESFLVFSSGTTGMPKAVRHSHRSLTAASIAWKASCVLTEKDRLQFFLPLGSVYGISTSTAAIAAGARTTLFPRFDLHTVLRHIERERVTVGFGAAPVAVAMAGEPDLEKYDLSSLRYFVWAATAGLTEVADQITARSGVRFLHAYGCSESPDMFCNVVARPETWRMDSPGIAAPDLSLRIVRSGTEEDVQPGEEGEITVNAPYRMLGYLPEEANEGIFLSDGHYRTGDVGRLEDGGWLRITGRTKEMIKVSGFAVAPVEIENILYQVSGVADCAVYRVPDPRTGEAPWAAVVRTPGSEIGEQELLDAVARSLARYKHLKGVRFVDAIPRNPAGKVLRRLLEDAAADGTPEQETSNA